MTTFISLSMVRSGAETYDDDGVLIAEGTETVRINPAFVRSFNPRRDGKPGTRITFADGGGFAVTESFDAICATLGCPTAQLAIAHQAD